MRASHIPHDPSSHIPSFHSFHLMALSSRSVVYSACRTPVSEAGAASAAASQVSLTCLIRMNESRLCDVSERAQSAFVEQHQLLHLLHSKQVPGVLRPYEMLSVQLPLLTSPPTSYPCLCMASDHVAGAPVASLFGRSSRYACGLPLSDFFAVSLSLFKTLAAVHEVHVMHGRLSTDSVLYDVYSQSTRVINFCTSHTSRYSLLSSPEPDSLVFLSPEQTGRVNRSVDHRSDLYSAGVVLYQMLTGQLPFASDLNDGLDLVHQVVTRQPTNPLLLRSTLPPMLGAVVLKLLCKNPDDRYQSASGAEHDLHTLHGQLSVMTNISRRRQHTRSPQILPSHDAPLIKEAHDLKASISGQTWKQIHGCPSPTSCTAAATSWTVCARYSTASTRPVTSPCSVSTAMQAVGRAAWCAMRVPPFALATPPPWSSAPSSTSTTVSRSTCSSRW
jgi:serine/threonine protein kinase